MALIKSYALLNFVNRKNVDNCIECHFNKHVEQSDIENVEKLAHDNVKRGGESHD